jgi:hypothetical protein
LAAGVPCSACSSSGVSRCARLEEHARPPVGVGHLALLLVGQRKNPQRQDFVDFGCIEKVARLSGAICG